MSVNILCTTNSHFYQLYASQLFESIAEFVPDSKVLLYSEDDYASLSRLLPNRLNVEVRKFPTELEEFHRECSTLKRQGRGVEGWIKYAKLLLHAVRTGERIPTFKPYNFYYDAKRFSYKSFAIFSALEECKGETVLYLDADVVLKETATITNILDAIEANRKSDTIYCYDRQSFTETGVILFNEIGNRVESFSRAFQSMYEDELIFKLPAYTDCHAFDAASKAVEGVVVGVSNGQGADPINHCEISKYLSHGKGEYKLD